MPVKDFIDYRADIIEVMSEKAAAQEKAIKNAKKNLPHMRGFRLRKK